VQALQDHFGVSWFEEEEGSGGGEGGERQIWQVGFGDGELMKVHFLQDQDMRFERWTERLQLFLGLERGEMMTMGTKVIFCNKDCIFISSESSN